MIKQIVIAIFILIVGISSGFGQDTCLQSQMLNKIVANDVEIYYLQYDGRPFLYDDWYEGNVTIVTGEVFEKCMLKIDLYKDQILYFNNTLKKQLVIDNELIDRIEIKNDLVNDVIVRYKQDTSTVDGIFYFELYSDSVSLWCKRTKEINLNTEFQSRYASLGTFYQKNKYYIVINNELTRFPLRKRKLMQYFPHIKKELGIFIRKNHYSLSREDHMVIIFKEINSLLSSDYEVNM